MDHKREHVRRLLQVDASISTMAGDQTWRAQIIDIARMGVAFVTTEELQSNSYLFSFSFPDSAARNDAVIDVVYCRPVGREGRFRSGARFQTISDECLERIVDYVTSGDASNRA